MIQRAQGSLLVEIQPFLVITSKDVLLLDTGLGFTHHTGSQLQLVKHLAENGFQTGDVTKVLMSHLHKDHTGGMINAARPRQLLSARSGDSSVLRATSRKVRAAPYVSR